MEQLRFVRVSGEGKEAKFNLYIDGKLAGDALSWAELMDILEMEGWA